ncbi:MAG: hypothetical protein Q9162_004189 [Coniocarpon cinnabarinum]
MATQHPHDETTAAKTTTEASQHESTGRSDKQMASQVSDQPQLAATLRHHQDDKASFGEMCKRFLKGRHDTYLHYSTPSPPNSQSANSSGADSVSEPPADQQPRKFIVHFKKTGKVTRIENGNHTDVWNIKHEGGYAVHWPDGEVQHTKPSGGKRGRFLNRSKDKDDGGNAGKGQGNGQGNGNGNGDGDAANPNAVTLVMKPDYKVEMVVEAVDDVISYSDVFFAIFLKCHTNLKREVQVILSAFKFMRPHQRTVFSKSNSFVSHRNSRSAILTTPFVLLTTTPVDITETNSPDMSTNQKEGESTSPKIGDDVDRYEFAFQVACESNDGPGGVSTALKSFLKKENLPPFYKFKANLALSDADQGNDPKQNIKTTAFYLMQAAVALEECKPVYVHEAEDADVLEKQGRNLMDEWRRLDARKRELGIEGKDGGTGDEPLTHVKQVWF